MKSLLLITAFVFSTAITALAQFGTLDSSFHNNGKRTINSLRNSYGIAGACVAVQADGKILVGGTDYSTIESTNEFLLMRFNSDGTIDTAFGSNGTITTLFFRGEDYALDIALQKDGKILLAGSLEVQNSVAYNDYAIARYNSNGTIDSAFGSSGPGQINSEVYLKGGALSITVLNNSEILVSGPSYTSDDDGYYDRGLGLAKYTSNGYLDNSFNKQGYKTILFGDSTAYGGKSVVLPNGKIIIAGTLQKEKYTITMSDIVMARLTENGSIDSSFGINGLATLHVNNNFLQLESMALQDDNKIIVIADISATDYYFNFTTNAIAAVRFNADGSIDSSFGSNGMVILQYNNKPGTNGKAISISNGKILIAGFSYSDSSFLLTALKQNGTIDSSFGVNGFTSTTFNNETKKRRAFANDMAIQKDGKIVLVGNLGSYPLYDFDGLAVARYHAQSILSNQDSLALVDLYNSTDGKHWTYNTNWLKGPVKTWYGITLSQPSGDQFFVKQINLPANNLKGTIPSSIGKLSFLQNLYLNNNQLGGNIPTALDSINSLITLDLSHNILSGNIPKQICQQSNLINLYLDNNNLNGSIPNVFRKNSQLVNLYLNQNSFTGAIPKSIGNLKQLQFLFLAHNDLTGAIPDTLRNLKLLKKLLLADNKLNGKLPFSLTSLQYLETLNIEHNHFTFSGMEALVQHNFSSFLYDNQHKIAIHQNGNKLSVNAGGTLSNNTYKWFNGSTLVATKHGDSTFTPSSPGNYSVNVTNSICAELTLYSSTVSITSADKDFYSNAVSNKLNTAFYISPNPAKNFINVFINCNAANATINVCDVNGKKLITQKEALQKQKAITINIASLAAGTYFIETITGDKTVRQMFVKQ